MSLHGMEMKSHDYTVMSDQELIQQAQQLEYVLRNSEVPRQLALAARLMSYLEFEVSSRVLEPADQIAAQ